MVDKPLLTVHIRGRETFLAYCPHVPVEIIDYDALETGHCPKCGRILTAYEHRPTSCRCGFEWDASEWGTA